MTTPADRHEMIPFGSVLFGGVVSTDEMQAIWSESNLLAKWILVERTISECQAELGMIPAEAAADIVASLTLERISPRAVLREARKSGHLIVAFLRAFREICGPAAEHFHLGPTTQDILDTGLTLQIWEAHNTWMLAALELEEALCLRAAEYQATPMMGRTHEQHALPYTFGFVLAGWAAELRDHIERAKQAEARWRFGSLTGGVGTQNAFVELSDVETARRLERLVCSRLGLETPASDIHGRLDRFVEVVSVLALAIATLGRIGLALRTMERPEVAEIEAHYEPEACSSSTMPNKRNPEAVERVEGLAHLVSGHLSAMLAMRIADHRDGTRIPVLYTAIPACYAMSHVALRTITGAIRTMRARPERMLANLDHPEALGQATAERLMLACYRKTGRKHEAHTLLSACAHRSRTTRRPFGEVVLEQDELRDLFSPTELSSLLDLRHYLGTSEAQVETVVTRLRPLNEADRRRYGARGATAGQA